MSFPFYQMTLVWRTPESEIPTSAPAALTHIVSYSDTSWFLNQRFHFKIYISIRLSIFLTGPHLVKKRYFIEISVAEIS